MRDDVGSGQATVEAATLASSVIKVLYQESRGALEENLRAAVPASGHCLSSGGGSGIKHGRGVAHARTVLYSTASGICKSSTDSGGSGQQ